MKARCKTAAVALLFALPVNAQIYRCEVDGTVAFSDRPCGSDSTLYTQIRGASFVTPDQNLPAIAEATQAYLRERRERMAQRRAAREAPSAPPEAKARIVETVFVPWPPERPWARYPYHRRLPDHSARDDGNAPPVIADNDRYSPLNGPILGTRPESAAFDSRVRPERRQNRDR